MQISLEIENQKKKEQEEEEMMLKRAIELSEKEERDRQNTLKQ